MLVDRCNEGRDIYAVLLKLQLRVARYELRGEPRQSKRDGYVHLRPRLVLPVDLVDPDADRAGGGRPWARPGGARTDLAGRLVWALAQGVEEFLCLPGRDEPLRQEVEDSPAFGAVAHAVTSRSPVVTSSSSLAVPAPMRWFASAPIPRAYRCQSRGVSRSPIFTRAVTSTSLPGRRRTSMEPVTVLMRCCPCVSTRPMSTSPALTSRSTAFASFALSWPASMLPRSAGNAPRTFSSPAFRFTSSPQPSGSSISTVLRWKPPSSRSKKFSSRPLLRRRTPSCVSSSSSCPSSLRAAGRVAAGLTITSTSPASISRLNQRGGVAPASGACRGASGPGPAGFGLAGSCWPAFEPWWASGAGPAGGTGSCGAAGWTGSACGGTGACAGCTNRACSSAS